MFYKFSLDKLFDFFSLNSIKINDIVEILIIIVCCYYLIKHFKGTRMYVLMKGIFVLFLIYALSSLFSLKIITNIFQNAIYFLAIALILMFQPELRKMLEHVGNKNFFRSIPSVLKRRDVSYKFSSKTTKSIINSVRQMSELKTGALILLEMNLPLDEFIDTGISLNSDVSAQLLSNIFEKNTPLHDGAVIIRKNKIIAATCYLPLSENKEIAKNLGTRHRAGIGASEITDAFVIIVSEETGNISIVKGGEIKHNISISDLEHELQVINKLESTGRRDKNYKSKFKRIAFATILGTVIWGTFSYIFNPIETIEFKGIPVEIANDDIIDDLNQLYTVVQGSTVNIEVTGTRDIVNSLSRSDFTAKADFAYLSITNSIPIEVSTEKTNIKIDTNNALMKIAVEEAQTITIPIEIQKQGKESSGFFAYSLSSGLPSVNVTGSKSILKTLDKAIVLVDVNNKSEDFKELCDLILYDKNGNVVSKDVYTSDIDKTEVSVMFCNTKKVELLIDVVNNDNFSEVEVINLDYSQKEIEIASSDDVLEQVKSIVIPVDITNNSDNNISSSVDINYYLPQNIYLVSDYQLNYTLSFVKKATKRIILEKENIKVIGGECEILNDTIYFDVSYDINAFAEMNAEAIKPYIDISEAKEGTTSVPLLFENDENVFFKDTVNVKIKK